MRARLVASGVAIAALAGCDAASLRPSDRGHVTEDGRDQVARVVDGDTVELRQLGKVRVIGADTPEVHGGRECFGTEASAYTERRLRPGTTVEYDFEREHRDRYGRNLVDLHVDGRLLSKDLIANGFAKASAIAPNTRYAARLQRAEDPRARSPSGLVGSVPIGLGARPGETRRTRRRTSAPPHRLTSYGWPCPRRRPRFARVSSSSVSDSNVLLNL